MPSSWSYRQERAVHERVTSYMVVKNMGSNLLHKTLKYSHLLHFSMMSEDVQSKIKIDIVESNRINPSCSTFFLVSMISLVYLCNLTGMIRHRGLSVIERKPIQAI
jgi:hypothetical protein